MVKLKYERMERLCSHYRKCCFTRQAAQYGQIAASVAFCAVAFSIMDLDSTNFIEKDEVRRILTVVLKDDPRIRLDDAMLVDIIEKVIVYLLSPLAQLRMIIAFMSWLPDPR